MTKKLLTIFFLLTLCLCGCKSNSDITASAYMNDAKGKIETTEKEIKSATETIRNSSNTINQEADVISQKTGTENQSDIPTHVDRIKIESNKINEEAIEIEESTENLAFAKKNMDLALSAVEIKSLEIKDLKSKVENLQKRIESELHKKIQWLVIACIVGIGLSIILMMYNLKMGVMMGGVCSIIMALSLAIEKYFLFLAIGGIGIIVLMVGLAIWYVVINRRALVETIKTVEVTKDNMEEDVKNKIFGIKGKEGEISTNVQSKTTQNLVKQEKEKIKKQITTN